MSQCHVNRPMLGFTHRHSVIRLVSDPGQGNEAVMRLQWSSGVGSNVVVIEGGDGDGGNWLVLWRDAGGGGGVVVGL